MKKATAITHLFVDIGGVLLTNGWDHHTRERAAAHFKLKWSEIEDRHHLVFETFEVGKFTLEEYLNMVVFTKKRPFTMAQFRNYMFAQSKPYPEMLALIRELKTLYGLKVIVVSNEGRELNSHRIQKFKLDNFVDSFISSSYVHVRKPDPEIFRLALDTSQASLKKVIYLENTSLFIQIAESMGIQSILHTDYASTCAQFAEFGLCLKS